MNNFFRPLRISAFSRRIAFSFACVFIFAASALGQTTTFAQFFEQFGTQDFVLVNNGTSGSLSHVPGGSPVFFIYQNIVGLPPSLQGIQSARLYVTTTTTLPGSSSSGTVNQPLNQITVIEIIRDTPAPPGTGGGDRTNLLTAVFSPNTQNPLMTGSDGGNAANISATTPDHTVIYGSHFLSFAATTQRNLAFSFSSVSPNFSLGAGSFLQNMNAAASGTFASSPVPIYAVPSSAGVSVAGRVLDNAGRGVGNAEVVLIDQDGATHIFRTGSFGHFEFEGLASGQTVIVTVNSKRHRFTTRVVDLSDNIDNLEITPVDEGSK
jgi:hypothetical protein